MWIEEHMLRESIREELAISRYMEYPKVKKPSYVLQLHIRGIGYLENAKVTVKEAGRERKLFIRDLIKDDRYKRCQVRVLNQNPYLGLSLVDKWEDIEKIEVLGTFKGGKVKEEHSELAKEFVLYDIITKTARLKVKNFTLGLSVLGSSAHWDLRWQITDTYLVGMTLLDPGRTGDNLSLSNEVGMGGRKILCEEKCYSEVCNDYLLEPILDEEGNVSFKHREEPTKEELARQPLVWLYVAGKKPAIIKPGDVGATSFSLGLFFRVDGGSYEMGSQKSTFFELFLDGKKFNGRWIFRQVPLPLLGEKKKPKKVTRISWQMWKPKNQNPYAPSARAKKKGWYPVRGRIPIPKKWKDDNPEAYAKWLEWVKEKWKEASLPEEEELERKIEWALIYATWRGSIVIRGVPNERWFLQLKLGTTIREWKLSEGPFFAEELTGLETRSLDRKYWKYSGVTEPKSRYNESKTLKGKAEVVDEGGGSLEDLTGAELGHYILELKGKEFKRSLEMIQDEKKSNLWRIMLGEKLEELVEPKAKKAFVLARHFYGEAIHWDISMERPDRPIKEGFDKWALVKNPLQAKIGLPIKVVKSSVCKDPRWFTFEGAIPPGGKAPDWLQGGNPTKNLTAYVKIEDRGTYSQIERKTGFQSFILKGRKIKGYYVFKEGDAGWFFIKARLPALEELAAGDPRNKPFSPFRVKEDEEGIDIALYGIRYFSSSLAKDRIQKYDLPRIPSGVELNLAKYPIPGKVHEVRVQSAYFSKPQWSKERALSWLREAKLVNWKATEIRG